MPEVLDYEQELLKTTRENIELAKEYRKSRKEYAENFNKLIVLINKAGLEKSKKSIDNKITELLAHSQYGVEANEIYKTMLLAQADYKGLKLVCEVYQSHSMGLQSLMKMQISGEINNNTRLKYGTNNEQT